MRSWKKLVGMGLLASVAYALWRATEPHGSPTVTWEPQPFPFPPMPAGASVSGPGIPARSERPEEKEPDAADAPEA